MGSEAGSETSEGLLSGASTLTGAHGESRVNQLEMVPRLVGIIGVLVETIEGLDPPDRSLTRVARLAAQLAT